LYALHPQNAKWSEKFSGAMAQPSNLWQAMGMGNKNAQKREKKKPKQDKPKRGNFVQPAPRVITQAPKG
jgi:hypothetical protein